MCRANLIPRPLLLGMCRANLIPRPLLLKEKGSNKLIYNDISPLSLRSGAGGEVHRGGIKWRGSELGIESWELGVGCSELRNECSELRIGNWEFGIEI
jgi:hypothetical protein